MVIIWLMIANNNLVGGIPTPLKHMTSSVSSQLNGKIKMIQTTNQHFSSQVFWSLSYINGLIFSVKSTTLVAGVISSHENNSLGLLHAKSEVVISLGVILSSAARQFFFVTGWQHVYRSSVAKKQEISMKLW
jgi:hypothetical protein